MRAGGVVRITRTVTVISAHAGTHHQHRLRSWVPAGAGMTAFFCEVA